MKFYSFFPFFSFAFAEMAASHDDEPKLSTKSMTPISPKTSMSDLSSQLCDYLSSQQTSLSDTIVSLDSEIDEVLKEAMLLMDCAMTMKGSMSSVSKSAKKSKKYIEHQQVLSSLDELEQENNFNNNTWG